MLVEQIHLTCTTCHTTKVATAEQLEEAKSIGCAFSACCKAVATAARVIVKQPPPPTHGERVTYEETFRKGAAPFPAEQIPVMRHTKDNLQPLEAYLLKQGTVRRGLRELGFQDVRVYYAGATQADKPKLSED